MVPAWAFPLFGVVGMFTFVAFVAVRAKRSTRAVHVVQPVPLDDEEAFLSDDSLVE